MGWNDALGAGDDDDSDRAHGRTTPAASGPRNRRMTGAEAEAAVGVVDAPRSDPRGAADTSGDPAPSPSRRPDLGEMEHTGYLTRRRRTRQQKGKRLDIQGLRAVAVVLVVVNHLTGKPVGGYLGVDVFFVISGYLITSLLLREDAATGSISMLDFYKRRIRRLFPTALTVTVLTIAAAAAIFGVERFRATATDGVWATLFAANWRLIDTGTDYFVESGPVSPFQHYWSLSVEEQFYIVWPAVLVLVLGLARRRFGGGGSALRYAGLTAAVALTVSSLAYAVLNRDGNSVVNYFSTFTRAWELGIGAVLAACGSSLFRRVGPVTATVLSWTGLALIAVSFAVIGETGVPFPAAVLPCVGAALVILGWSERGAAKNIVLTNPVSVYLGDISYSVYVVHFPIIIMAQALSPEFPVVTYWTVALLVTGVSILVFHLIEDPVRRSNWLASRRTRSRVVADRVADTRRRPAVTIATALVVGGLSLYVLAAPPPDPGQASVIAAAVSDPVATATGGTQSTADTTPVPAGPLAADLNARVQQALLVSDWPELNPPFGASEPRGTQGCPQDFRPASECTFGNNAGASKTFYMVGDSTSASYFLGVKAMADLTPDYDVRTAGSAGCPFADRLLNTNDGNPFAADCLSRNDQIVAEIQQLKPAVLIVTNARFDADFMAGTRAELAKVKDDVGTIVVLPNAPKGKDPSSCYTRLSQPAACVATVDSDYQSWSANARSLAAEFGGLFVDPTTWFSAAGYIPSFVGTTPVHRDDVHMTAVYSESLGPVLLEAFRAVGAVPAA